MKQSELKPGDIFYIQLDGLPKEAHYLYLYKGEGRAMGICIPNSIRGTKPLGESFDLHAIGDVRLVDLEVFRANTYESLFKTWNEDD